MTPAERIYNQAIAGTPNNPGVPAALANLMVAQSRHETGDYTSSFFRNYNNAFGYAYYPASNYQTGAGPTADNGTPIAVYPSVEDSTKEVIDWIYRRSRAGIFPANLSVITTPEQYAVLLKKAGYFGDTLTNYLNGLKKYFTPVSMAIGLMIGLGILTYIFRRELFA